ncbi:hypothetical protein CFP56_039132 [Quercus suber]|uniref:Zinc knuckle CX2CX4HX4C domain-containing protein n=1 Tax=Quercus suber TaxID=58331 RepID=A0AAW0LNG8_QUESU
MDDEVANRLEKMKLTIEEEEVIPISDEGRLDAIESCNLTREVGSRLGTVEEVERRHRKDDINMFMRVRVALPIAKPLRRSGFIAGSDGEKMWVSFKYERLPMFCHFCGILGHDLKNCAAHFTAEKQGRRVEYQYGEFLKANGSRPRASTTKPVFSMSSAEDGNGSTVKQKSDQAVRGEVQVQPAARENRMENPSNVERVFP